MIFLYKTQSVYGSIKRNRGWYSRQRIQSPNHKLMAFGEDQVMAGCNTARHSQNPQYVLAEIVQRIRVNPEKVFQGSPCWEWRDKIDPAGYAPWVRLKERYAHRISHILFIGPIPEKYHVDHVCRNRSCISPFHLEAITGEENRRRRNESATHCKHGHEYTPENTKILPIRRGQKWECVGRVCQICARERSRQHYRRNPESCKEAARRYMAKRKARIQAEKEKGGGA